MMPHEVGEPTAHSEFEDLKEAERALKKALTVIDWSKVPVVFPREVAKVVLAMVSEEVRDRSRTTLISEEVVTGVDYGQGASSQV